MADKTPDNLTEYQRGALAALHEAKTMGLAHATLADGFWRDADWLYCHDGKWRPVKPGLKPLVNGSAGRVGQLRAYGNAIVAPVVEAFMAAYLESTQ
ncbi:hypothetical protein ACO03_11755 [Pantoea ananatis]|nr:hypothetical protein ACO03_11755 [Pantoea ananatis]